MENLISAAHITSSSCLDKCNRVVSNFIPSSSINKCNSEKTWTLNPAVSPWWSFGGNRKSHRLFRTRQSPKTRYRGMDLATGISSWTESQSKVMRIDLISGLLSCLQKKSEIKKAASQLHRTWRALSFPLLRMFLAALRAAKRGLTLWGCTRDFNYIDIVRGLFLIWARTFRLWRLTRAQNRGFSWACSHRDIFLKIWR